MSNDPPDIVHTSRARRSKTGCLWGCLVLPAVLVIIAVFAAVGIWGTVTYRVNRELAIEVQKVRAQGEPLNTVELNDYYVAAPDRPDMTKEILSAIAECEAPSLKDEARGLRFLWDQSLIPAASEPWD